MNGPYPFLRVNEQPVYMSVLWVAVIMGGAYLLAWLILLASRRYSGITSPARDRCLL